MKTVEVSRLIAAPRPVVWAALTDAQTLQAGDLGIMRIEGTIAANAHIKLWSEVSPARPFHLTVSELSAPASMTWSGGMPLGLFMGTRRFRLTEADGGTQFDMREEFTGLLSGLITKSMPDLRPSFEKFADGLKRISEGGRA